MDLKRIHKGIYWDQAWSLIEGCTHVSAGCSHCWAASQAAMRSNHPNPKISEPLEGLVDRYGYWTGQIRLRFDNLDKPIAARAPRTWSIWNDLFHESVPFEFVSQAFEVIAECPQHSFIILTKRPRRMREFIERWQFIEGRPFCLDNAILGVSAENKELLNTRMGWLRGVKGHHIVSVEPMLGPVPLAPFDGDRLTDDSLTLDDWIVVGTETGARRRPARIEWVRELVQNCQAAEIPVFVKQVSVKGRATSDMSLWPEDIRVRQIPAWLKGNV